MQQPANGIKSHTVLIVKAFLYISTWAGQQQGDMGAIHWWNTWLPRVLQSGASTSYSSCSSHLVPYRHSSNYTTNSKATKSPLQRQRLTDCSNKHQKSTTAESPSSSSSSSSSSSLYEWSLSLIANCCHSTRPSWMKYSAVHPVYFFFFLEAAFFSLYHRTSKGAGGVSRCDAKRRCRGLLVLRAGCIHPSAPAAPSRRRFGSGSLRRDDCRISLYIRFSSFMILHKLIQLDNQREKLTHVS